MRASRFLSLSIFCLAGILISGCSSLKTDTSSYPQDPKDAHRERGGKLSGEDGLVIFGGKKKDEDTSGNAGIGINSYLWRAVLDTISFMPLASADPFGGVIVTDWYEDPAKRGERFKLTVLIFDRRLRSDAVKVSVFKQIRDGKNNWRDEKSSERLARDLENTILTRARELRNADSSKK